jgi:hypothetical protein
MPKIVPMCIRQIEQRGSGFRQLGQHDSYNFTSIIGRLKHELLIPLFSH